MDKQTYNFKIKGKDYEVFFAMDGAVELYEKDNPIEGFIFPSKKHLLMFVNVLTDTLEGIQMENI